MTTTVQPHPARSVDRHRRPLLVRAGGLICAAIAIAVASQVLGASRTGATRPSPAALPATVSDPATGGEAPAIVDLDPGGATGGAATDADTIRIKANIEFWSAKLRAHANDFVAAEKLGESRIELARATGDLSSYVAAGQAFDAALALYPDMAAARAFKGVVLVSLHQFGPARTLASDILDESPDDPTALATLGDASLELGDVGAARTAYDRLALVAPGAASDVRLGHLAFITGDIATAVRDARAAVRASDTDEDTVGERAGFYRYQLADTLIATGDRPGAEKAYRDAIKHDPRSFLAHAGLGRALAADGKLDAAISELSAAIAIIPQPDMLARRSDLYELRNAAGDATLAARDRRTVLAIAQLATAAGNVYDRTLSLYLANHGLDTARAVDLAAAELETRKDVYGYDALAWALLADGRSAEAGNAIRSALAVGTMDAKVLYHAGMIELALGETAAGRGHLQAALDLDPSFDALQAERARAALAGG